MSQREPSLVTHFAACGIFYYYKQTHLNMQAAFREFLPHAAFFLQYMTCFLYISKKTTLPRRLLFRVTGYSSRRPLLPLFIILYCDLLRAVFRFDVWGVIRFALLVSRCAYGLRSLPLPATRSLLTIRRAAHIRSQSHLGVLKS